MNGVFEVTDATFKSEVLDAEGVVLVDFWAPWCGPCKAIAPHLEVVADTFAGQIKVYKMNVDDSPQTPQKYGIRSIPNLIWFNGGEQISQMVGFVEGDKIVDQCNGILI